jgi:cobalt/nickel transport system permease protein
MHISDGVLPAEVWGTGLALTAGALWVSVRRFDERLVPQIAVMTSLFFVAASIPLPLGFTSVHLLLVGLMGIVLGWLSIPALLVALFLQFVLLGTVGGITTLGVNTLTMGAGALVSRWVFQALRRGGKTVVCPQAFVASLVGVTCSGVAFMGVMATAGKDIESVARWVFLAHLPVMVLDGLVTQAAVSFLARVKPEMIPDSNATGLGRRPSDRQQASGPAGRITGCGILLGLVLPLAILIPVPCEGHGLDILARTDGRRVKVEAFFLDGAPARGATVTVRTVPEGDPDSGQSRIVAEGVTDREGLFYFRPQRLEDLEIVVEDEGGHRRSRVVSGGKLAALFSGEQPEELLADSEGGTRGAGPLWLRLLLGVMAIVGLALLTRRLVRGGRIRHAPGD